MPLVSRPMLRNCVGQLVTLSPVWEKKMPSHVLVNYLRPEKWAHRLVITIGIGLAAFVLPVAAADARDETPARQQALVVTANPHATDAGVAILEQGGSAVDAAVAVQSVLSLVEPQSSGMAGGAIMVYFDATSREITIYDGREAAPASATPTMFLRADGSRLPYLEAKNSGLSTGVPGVVAMLAMAQGERGKLDWGDLFGDAIRLSEDGYPLSQRTHFFLANYGRVIPSKREDGPLDAYNYFYGADGKPYPVGYQMKNPAYAQSLRAIAEDYRALYEGPLAEEIVAMVGQSPRAGGISLEDLKNFKPKKTTALCAPYREVTLCGPRPESSWVAVAMIMGMLERGPAFSDKGADDPANWGLFLDAQRLAYADRDHYVADPAFVDVPVRGMLDDGYLKSRAAALKVGAALGHVDHGTPPALAPATAMLGRDATDDRPGTSHFVIVDHGGNVVSMTTTVESLFGSARMAGGMFLNNQLTDFSFQPVDKDGKPVANAVAPYKRPRTSMSPTIVLDEDGDFLLATGSPGGNSIIAYTAKSLVGMLDWGLTPQEAVSLPNMIARGDTIRAEADRTPDELRAGLAKLGFDLAPPRGENSGLGVIMRLPDGSLAAGVDPRREGTARTVP